MVALLLEVERTSSEEQCPKLKNGSQDKERVSTGTVVLIGSNERPRPFKSEPAGR